MSIQKTQMPKKRIISSKKMVKPQHILYAELINSLKNKKTNFHNFQSYIEDLKNDMVMKLFIYGSTEGEEFEMMEENMRSFFPKLKEDKILDKYSFVNKQRII
jgi:secreted Zn-dependent insulinase-like peptidase